MHPSLDDCFHFWSIFIRLHEDWKRVIDDNVNDQRYVGYPTQGLAKYLVTLQIGKELTVAGAMIKRFMPLKISQMYKKWLFIVSSNKRGRVYEIKLADDKFKSKW